MNTVRPTGESNEPGSGCVCGGGGGWEGDLRDQGVRILGGG